MFKSLIDTIQTEPKRFFQDAIGMASVFLIFFVGLHLPLIF